MEAIGSGLVQYGLWGSDGRDDQRAGWAFARVQGLLGPESVLTPVLSGGRGPADRITLVPWGDERVPERDPTAPWPGALPAPTPTRLTDPETSRLTLLDHHREPVTVTGRGLLSADPAWVVRTPSGDDKQVTGWAGPWLLDERWWSVTGGAPSRGRPSDGRSVFPPPRYQARMQLLLDEGPALLVCFGVQGWSVEGVYD